MANERSESVVDKYPQNCVNVLLSFGLKQNDQALDLGCGQGNQMQQLAEIGINNVTGIDVNPDNLPTDNMVVVADWNKMPFKENIFDCAYMFSSPLSESSSEKYSEVSRVLKPGGIFIYDDIVFEELMRTHTLRESQLTEEKVIPLQEDADGNQITIVQESFLEEKSHKRLIKVRTYNRGDLVFSDDYSSTVKSLDQHRSGLLPFGFEYVGVVTIHQESKDNLLEPRTFLKFVKTL